MNLEGRICAVTGAGRGIGWQIASDFVRQGARVYVCDISQESLAAVRQESAKSGWNMTFAVCDVSDERSVMNWFESIQRAENRLDVLVNNAGITRDGLLVRVKDEEVTRLPLIDFERVVDVSLKGTFLCAREAAAIMARHGGGVIVNISSISRAGNFGQTNYSAAKAVIDAMTVTWSKELARYKIRVAAVAPGYTHTEMVAGVSPVVLEKIVAQVPLRRLGEPTEISSAVRFIVENDFVTGRTLEIDGGLRI
jgi:3-oxoacyl-[acyl-carrier protein] reductase